ncbi:MAG TPA: nitroreductase family deazaflavin-dependent oxidoreductase [Dehalococcoidia bacterium]
MNDFNKNIIAEFRANKGAVGGPFKGAPLLLLTSKGAKSGKEHTTPLMYLPDGERIAIFASMGGAPKNPAWYHNVVANPKVRVEAGAESFEATATVAQGSERDDLYARQSKAYPQFAEYQQKTSRKIPVVILKRR